jgi:hypothetical protein
MGGPIKDLEKVLRIEISDDRMEAKIIAIGSTERLTRDDGVSFLKAYDVLEGYVLDALDRLSNLELGQGLICAQGARSEPTIQSKIDYFFPIDQRSPAGGDTDRPVDFREIGRFNNAEVGKVLAVLTQGKLGSPGKDIFGRVIQPDQLLKKTILAGKLVELSPDGLKAVAKASGHACRIDGKITILPKIQIPGDVDYSIGNIRFIGDVDIAGNILTGFTVEVEGNLMVAKNIENSRVKVGKDLTVHGNVFGRGGCVIEAGGNAKFNEIDSATMEVMGDLSVRNGIRHSTVRCGGSIQITGKNGVIVGGEVSAFQHIKTVNLGNSMGTLTKVSVGVNPFIYQKMAAMGKVLDDLRVKLTQVQNNISVLERKIMAGGSQDALMELNEKLLAAESAVLTEIRERETETEQLKLQIGEIAKANIEVSGTLYSSVFLFVRRSKTRTYDELKSVRAEEIGGEIKFYNVSEKS